MNNNDFCKEIKDLRNKKGLSQEELANLSGLSLRTIQRIEKGETNPIGDTKRKIIKILESYPDTDFRNNQKNIEKNNSQQKILIKYEYILIIYVFSLLAILIGFIGVPIFLVSGLIIGFLSLIALFISTVNHIKKRGLLLVLIMFMIPVKSIRTETNGGVTIKIERNLITGKSDTLVTNQRINIF